MNQLIIAVMSCRQNRDKQQLAIRETWFQDIPDGVTALFFEGGYQGEETVEGDTVYLNCGDGYQDLALKTHRFLNFCRDHFQYDFIFKCDDDTYVHIPRLLACGFESFDYVGNKPPHDYWKQGIYAQGGAYFLSRQAADTIALTPFESGRDKRWWWGGLDLKPGKRGGSQSKASTEDVMVGDILRERGFELHIDERFQHNASPNPYSNDRQITSHHVSAAKMRVIHRQKTWRNFKETILLQNR